MNIFLVILNMKDGNILYKHVVATDKLDARIQALNPMSDRADVDMITIKSVKIDGYTLVPIPNEELYNRVTDNDK